MATEHIYTGSVFAAGILSFFSPCILPLLPVYLAQLGGAAPSERNGAVTFGSLRIYPSLILNTLAFVLGVSFVFVLLGFGAGALGSVINTSWFMLICGCIVIMFGLFQTGLIRLSWLQRERRLSIDWSGKRGVAASLLLGFTFSFGWTPCIGPVLAAVLGLSASEGSSVQGGAYMVIYSLGFAVPFLAMSLFAEALIGRLRKLNQYTAALRIVSGILLIAMGVLLLTNDLYRIVAWF